MSASGVQVNDEEGKSLGKVKVGDTKLQALQRVAQAGGLFDKDDIGLLDDDVITAEGAPYVFKPTLQNQQELSKQVAQLKDRQRKLEFQLLQTSMRLTAYNEDMLSDAFDQAQITTSFWLPTLQNSQSWTGLVQRGYELEQSQSYWDMFKIVDKERTETKSIQPAVDELQKSFPEASPYTMKKTCNGWEKMTQDATLFLKNRSEVHTTVAALFEWVGQDESPFPSIRHKAKFVRDCARLYEKCGGHREVHGVISDLSRIVAVKFIGYDGDGNLRVEKTPVYTGDLVRTVLTQFAFAEPCHLGFDLMSRAHWSFNNTMVEGGRILGEGLHGSVFSVINGPRQFVKTFENEEDCQREVVSLQRLNEHNPRVPSVPRLLGVSTDRRAILASPVGSPVEELRGRLLAWKAAAEFVVCLEHVHKAGLCHRDVRPSNMGYTNDDACLDVVLFDWASSCDLGSRPVFSGTLHYAAQDVLQSLADLGDPEPLAEYDLESLVYSFWDITRDTYERPRPIMIGMVVGEPVSLSARRIQQAWLEEERSNPLIKRLLSHARAKDYGSLRLELKSLHG